MLSLSLSAKAKERRTTGPRQADAVETAAKRCLVRCGLGNPVRECPVKRVVQFVVIVVVDFFFGSVDFLDVDVDVDVNINVSDDGGDGDEDGDICDDAQPTALALRDLYAHP